MLLLHELLQNFKQKVPIKDLFDIYVGESIGKYTAAHSDGNFRIIAPNDVPALAYTSFNFATLDRVHVSDENKVVAVEPDDYLIKIQGCVEGYSLLFSRYGYSNYRPRVLVGDSFLVLRLKEFWRSFAGNNINYFHYLLDNLVLKIKKSLPSGSVNISAETIGLSKIYINLSRSETLEADLEAINRMYAERGQYAAKIAKISDDMLSLIKANSSFDSELIELDANTIKKTEVIAPEVRGNKKYWIIDNNVRKSLKDWARENKHRFDSPKYNFDKKILPTTQEIERVLRKLNFKRYESAEDNDVTYR